MATGDRIVQSGLIFQENAKEVWDQVGTSPLASGIPEIAITAADTLTLGARHFVTATSTDYTVTLPPAADCVDGYLEIRISPDSTKTVEVDGDGAELINGAASFNMDAFDTATLFCDGVEWTITGGISAIGGAVDSVNGYTGVVVLDTDNIAEGSTNEYYTDAKVSANSSVVANTAKVSNATHTGDVTGSVALTLNKGAIKNQTAVAASALDSVVITDNSDADNLKKTTLQEIADLSIGGAIANDQVGIGSGTDTIDGSSNLTFDRNKLTLFSTSSLGNAYLRNYISDIIIGNGLGGTAEFRLLPYLTGVYFENTVVGDLIFRSDSLGTPKEVARMKANGTLNLTNLPTSASGLATGDVWNNSGVLNIV